MHLLLSTLMDLFRFFFFGESESQLGRLRNEAELASASPVLAYMLAYTQGTVHESRQGQLAERQR